MFYNSPHHYIFGSTSFRIEYFGIQLHSIEYVAERRLQGIIMPTRDLKQEK